MSLNTSYWGGPVWKTMYILAYAVPEQADLMQISNIRELFNRLGPALPCAECSAHYSTYIKRHPIPNTRSALLQWVNTMHNDVQRRIGKPAVALNDVLTELKANDPTLRKTQTPIQRSVQNTPPAIQIARNTRPQMGVRVPGRPQRFVRRKGCNCGKK